MATVIGKEQLCSTDLKDFRAVQGIDEKTLFDRYKLAESNIINKYIDSKYRDFLAYPVREGDTITFHGKACNETPRLLSNLQGDDLAKYQNLKAETLAHFNKETDLLKKSGKTIEAEFLAAATKHVDDRFVYCYDDKVILGVWGMQLRDNMRADVSEIRKDWTAKARQLRHEPQPPPLNPEPEPVVIDNLQPEPESSVNPFTVRFNAGEHGNLHGTSEYAKYDGDIVTESEAPQVKAKEGYEFTGWDKNPNNYTVINNTEFVAQYREIQPIVTPITPIPWWRGCLNWLLLLLLSALIFMMVWCCLLKKCKINCCGCQEDIAIIIPEPRVKPTPQKQTVEGTEFWLTFGANYPTERNLYEHDLQIRIVSGASPATGTIHFTNLGTSVNFDIAARQVYTYRLDNAQKQAVYNTTKGKSNRSIYITSNESVTVYALNQAAHTTDATNVLPVTALGVEYYQISYTTLFSLQDAYAVVGVKNNTQLYHNGTLAATLDVGDVYYMTSNTDMTGAHITADNSVAFFAVNQGTNIPVGFSAGDCLMQQLPPVNTWGNNFFVPVSHRTRDIVRIVASKDNTNITQTGGRLLFPAGGQKNLTNLQAGQFVELEVSLNNNGCFIQADNPVGVCAYLTGCSYNPPYDSSDPAQSWLPAIEQTVTETLIAPFIPKGNTALNAHYALVITSTGTKDDTRVSIGGATPTALTGGNWRDNAAAGMSFYTMPLTRPAESYHFTNQAGLIIMCYGVGSAESYYFLAFSAMRNLNKKNN